MSEFKQILKHSRNYLAANLATKALAFITIPVYTRLLNTNDYGIVTIFLGVGGILGSIMAFSMDRSISRYYFDQESHEDFCRFNGTSLLLACLAFILNSIILILYAEEFADLVRLDVRVVYFLIPLTLINIIGLTFEQIFGPQKKSKKIALSSLFRVYTGFTISIIFIVILDSEKYYGLIYGQIIAGSLLAIYWIKEIKSYFIIEYNAVYAKYIFTYSVPLIPYALSGVIIEQFGKIAIGSSHSVSDAGFYGLALAIGSLVSIVIGVTHQAWNPYYMEYMNSKNYEQLDRDFIRIFKITLIVAYFIALFGEEIGHLLAKDEFTSSLYLIPLFTIGYIFYQLAYAYLRNFGYAKKTQFMTLAVLSSGVSNVILNSILIPSMNELGAAISFVSSYAIMGFVAWIINRYIVKQHATSLAYLLIPLLISTPFYLIIYYLGFIHYTFLILIVKCLLWIMLTVILFYKEKERIIDSVKGMLSKTRIKIICS